MDKSKILARSDSEEIRPGVLSDTIRQQVGRMRIVSSFIIAFSIALAIGAAYIGNNALGETMSLISGASVMGLSIWILVLARSGTLIKFIAFSAIILALSSQCLNILDEFPIIKTIPILNQEGMVWVIRRISLMLGIILFIVALYLAVIESGINRMRLRDERDFFSNVMGGTSTLICVISPDKKIDYVNQAVLRLKGVEKSGLIGKDWWECMVAGNLSDPQRTVDMFSAQDVQDYVLPCLDANGERHYISWSSNNHYDESGRLIESFRFGTDISQRRASEEERARLARAIEQSRELVAITDQLGCTTYVNPAFTEVTGYTREDVLGKKLYKLGKGQYSKEMVQSLLNSLASGEMWRGHLQHRTVDKRDLELNVTVSPILDKEGAIDGFVVTYRDVTHESEMDKQLRHAQKMQAVGTLAGGVAHDFNNILSPIIGYTEMAMHEVPRESAAYKYLVNIMDAGLRAKDLVKQILSFSRQTDQERKPVRLAPILREAMKLVRGSLPASIDIQENINSNCPPVLADPTQFHQVLMNLCTNSFHAMEKDGGILSVSLKTERVTPSQAERHPELEVGDYCCLTVADTGQGIDDAILHRVFEPYFTTKSDGKGIGLGLATVHGIVRAHGGAVIVNSRKGEGVSIRVYIPVLQDIQADNSAEEYPIPQGNGQHILLVEDEFSVLQVTQRLLGRMGYEVTACSSPVEALSLFQKSPESFELLLTDLSMPKMNGMQLASAMLALKADMPVLLTTGFNTPELQEEAREAGIFAIAPKPLTPQELGRHVYEALHSRFAAHAQGEA